MNVSRRRDCCPYPTWGTYQPLFSQSPDRPPRLEELEQRPEEHYEDDGRKCDWDRLLIFKRHPEMIVC